MAHVSNHRKVTTRSHTAAVQGGIDAFFLSRLNLTYEDIKDDTGSINTFTKSLKDHGSRLTEFFEAASFSPFSFLRANMGPRLPWIFIEVVSE